MIFCDAHLHIAQVGRLADFSQGAGRELCTELIQQVSADACLDVLEKAGLREKVMRSILSAVQEHLDLRAAGRLETGAVLFSNAYGTLGMTEGAQKLLAAWGRS